MSVCANLFYMHRSIRVKASILTLYMFFDHFTHLADFHAITSIHITQTFMFFQSRKEPLYISHENNAEEYPRFSESSIKNGHWPLPRLSICMMMIKYLHSTINSLQHQKPEKINPEKKLYLENSTWKNIEIGVKCSLLICSILLMCNTHNRGY